MLMLLKVVHSAGELLRAQTAKQSARISEFKRAALERAKNGKPMRKPLQSMRGTIEHSLIVWRQRKPTKARQRAAPEPEYRNRNYLSKLGE